MANDSVARDLDLSGNWRAAAASDELRREWNNDDFADNDFVDITVPGHWRTTEAFADEDGPLLYRRRFDTHKPDTHQRSWLWLDGLFYQGDVWLDGSYLGDTEGYFAPHHFEITEKLAQRTEHLLGVEVHCPPVSDRNNKRNLTGVYQDGPFLDPNANPGGIWQPVRVRNTGPIAITRFNVLCTDATAERALVTCSATLDANEPCHVLISTVIGALDHRQTRTLAAGENQVTWTLPIPEPALWWPRVLGNQPMHDVRVGVALTDRTDIDTQQDAFDPDTFAPTNTGDPAPLTFSDTVQRSLGLRAITMRNYVMAINGERLFLKGVGIGPLDETPASTNPDDLRALVDTVVDAGLDLIRVTGHVARPELYDAADASGLLIWQDLPMQWGYNRSVRTTAANQARAAVDVLGHHPSIVVWSGQNEPHLPSRALCQDEPEGFTRRVLDHELPSFSRSTLSRAIRRAFSGADPSRPVVPASGLWPHAPKLDGSDIHLTLGWAHGEPEDLAAIARAVPRAVRFVGAFGTQSVPATHDFIDDAMWPDLDFATLAMRYGMDVPTFQRRLPPDVFDNVDQWAQASRNFQAQVTRRIVETLRRLKYRPTGGYIAAHLHDARPAISSALIDHTGEPKEAFHALQSASRPVLVTLDPWPSHLHPGDVHVLAVHVVSDLREPLPAAVLDISATWDGGEIKWEFGGDLDADSCTFIGEITLNVPEIDAALAVTATLRARGHESHHQYVGTVHSHH